MHLGHRRSRHNEHRRSNAEQPSAGPAASRTPPHRSVRQLTIRQHQTVLSCKHPNTHASRPGPKSGSYLQFLVFLNCTMEIEGARIPPVSATGGGPVGCLPTAGKHCGQALSRVPATYSLSGAKRAFRRARLRASQSSEGGTWYRGRELDVRNRLVVRVLVEVGFAAAIIAHELHQRTKPPRKDNNRKDPAKERTRAHVLRAKGLHHHHHHRHHHRHRHHHHHHHRIIVQNRCTCQCFGRARARHEGL